MGRALDTEPRIYRRERKTPLQDTMSRVSKMRYYYLLLVPIFIYFVVFHYLPMYGVVLAFKDFNPRIGIFGSPWIGLHHFERFIGSYHFERVVGNTLIISLLRLVLGFPAPVILALLLNEIRRTTFKRVVQTISYLPHFISWVVMAGIIMELLSPTRGVVNQILQSLGVEPVYFLGESDYFRGVVVATGIWKSVGWGTIIYLAAISGVDVELFDSAHMDGTNRFQDVWYIILPSIRSTILILLVLNTGQILNAGFDQIFNLYNPLVYDVGDIIDTYVYRVGLEYFEFSFATAVGLFKNLIGLVLVVVTNYIVTRLSGGEAGLW